MRICADCSLPIRLRHRWHISECKVRHVSCANPTMLEPALPLNFTAPLPILDELPPAPVTLRERFDHCVGSIDLVLRPYPTFQKRHGK